MGKIRRWTSKTHKERIHDPWNMIIGERIKQIQTFNITSIWITQGLEKNVWDLEWTEKVEVKDDGGRTIGQ